MKAVLAALLLASASALAADEITWDWVFVDTNQANVVEGQPATVRVAWACLICDPVIANLANDYPVTPADVITWSFGDGSADVTVTGSARVTHTFPRGWHVVTAKFRAHTLQKRVFSAPVFNDPPSIVNFSAPPSISEAAGPFVIHLTRSGNSSVSSSIGFSVDSGNAWVTTAGGTATFAPGETSKDISIGLVNDTLWEGSRTIAVTLWSVDGATLHVDAPQPNVAMVQLNRTILDDDPPPTLSINNIRVNEGDSGTSNATFTIRLSAPAGRDIVLYPQPTGGNATPGEDYIVSSNALVIPAGATSVSLSVPIIGDRVAEPDEGFFMYVYTDGLGSVAGQCIIANDDATLTPGAARLVAGTNATLIFDVGNPVPAAMTVAVTSSSPGIASVPPSVMLPAGSARAAIPLQVLVPGQTTIQATAGTIVAQAHVDAVDATTLHVAPASIVLAVGDEETVHLSFAPPVATPHTVTSTARVPGVVSLPASVIVPAGATADVTLHATSSGSVVIDLIAGDLLSAASLQAEVVAAGAPAIDAVAPQFGQAGAHVTISGARFTDRCSVRFGDQPATVASRTGSLLEVIAPANGAGAVDVTVTCGALHAAKARAFTYTSPRRRSAR